MFEWSSVNLLEPMRDVAHILSFSPPSSFHFPFPRHYLSLSCFCLWKWSQDPGLFASPFIFPFLSACWLSWAKKLQHTRLHWLVGLDALSNCFVLVFRKRVIILAVWTNKRELIWAKHPTSLQDMGGGLGLKWLCGGSSTPSINVCPLISSCITFHRLSNLGDYIS